MLFLNNLNTTKYPSPWGEGNDSQIIQLTVALDRYSMNLEAAVEIICKQAVLEMLSRQIGLSLVNSSTQILSYL